MTEKELFFRYLGLPSFTPMELEIIGAEGIWFFGANGQKYMDLVSGITVSNLGHRHPAVVAAIKDQADRYLHLNVYGEFVQSPQVHMAEKLANILPPSLCATYFVNSGSEAIEGAMKLAKRFTGRTGIVAFRNAYHGSTHGCLSLMSDESLKSAFRPLLPDVRHLDFNETEQLSMINRQTACVVMETIQAEAGIVPARQDFIGRIREKCSETGALLIVDDIQMGLGRTGKLFSFEHYGMVPDILVLAKALGAGMPLGAFISSREIMNTLAFKPELGHITTFGGHPVSCAAGLAGLEILTGDDIIGQAEAKGERFMQHLKGNHSLKDIRRIGLALGLDLAQPDKRNSFMEKAIHAGVIIDWYLFRPATFRIAPPLTITMEEIDLACEKLNETLSML